MALSRIASVEVIDMATDTAITYTDINNTDINNTEHTMTACT